MFHLVGHNESAVLQGNCSDSAAAAALNLTAAEADQLLPIKPFQCLIVVDDTWLMVNNGVVWVDNLHLKIIRRTVQPILPFISAGLQSADTPIGASQIYATNITFQAEHRGSASAIFVDINEVAVYVDGACLPLSCGFASLSRCAVCRSSDPWPPWAPCQPRAIPCQETESHCTAS